MTSMKYKIKIFFLQIYLLILWPFRWSFKGYSFEEDYKALWRIAWRY